MESCPGGSNQGGICPGGSHQGGICPGGKCPVGSCPKPPSIGYKSKIFCNLA